MYAFAMSFFFSFYLHRSVFLLSFFLFSLPIVCTQDSRFCEDFLGLLVVVTGLEGYEWNEMYSTCFHLLPLGSGQAGYIVLVQMTSIKLDISSPRIVKQTLYHNHPFNNSINKPNQFDSIHHTLTCISGYHDFKVDPIANDNRGPAFKKNGVKEKKKNAIIPTYRMI